MGNPVLNDRQLEYFPLKHPFNELQNVIETVNFALTLKATRMEATSPSFVFVIDESKWQ